MPSARSPQDLSSYVNWNYSFLAYLFSGTGCLRKTLNRLLKMQNEERIKEVFNTGNS